MALLRTSEIREMSVDERAAKLREGRLVHEGVGAPGQGRDRLAWRGVGGVGDGCSPIARIEAAEGPIKVRLADSTAAAKEAFSERKP